MDLRSRTVPDRRTINPEPSEGSECEGGRFDIQGSPNAPTIILDGEDEDLVYFLMQKRRANQRAVYF